MRSRARTIVQLQMRVWASRPQLKRDPLDRANEPMQQSLDPTTVGIIAGYVLLGLAYGLFVDWLPGGNKAQRFLILYPIMMLAFLFVVRVMWGQLPLFIVIMVGVVAIANVLQIRFCARCGSVQLRRSIFSSKSGCRRCGGDQYLPLWKALKGPGQSGAV